MGSEMGSDPMRYQKFGESAPLELSNFITQRYGQHVMIRVERFPARHFLDKYRRFNSFSCEMVYAEAGVNIRGWGMIKYSIREPFCYWMIRDPTLAREWKAPEQIDDPGKPRRKPWLKALSHSRGHGRKVA